MTQAIHIELAQVGYKAYGEWTEWKNYRGDAMPTWAEPPAMQRYAWVAAAGAIERALLTPQKE